MSVPAESFFLDTAGDGTLQHRIKRIVITGILSGRFRPGERMPSTRGLARHLGVSRITVAYAYTDLVADDYIVARGRSGYFVSDTAPKPQAPPSTVDAESARALDWAHLIGAPPERAATVERPVDWQRYPYPFIYGQTDPKLFDHQNWRLCALQALSQRDFDALTADHYDRDDPKLVEYIIRQILPRRGISARPDTVLITLGAQNALWLTAQLLLSPSRVAAIENPGYPALRDVLSETRCRVVPVDVDARGLPPGAIDPESHVIFTTVSHQSPTNVTMPLDRRRALLDLAAERGAVIVEDDYEFELSFQRAASPALKSLDTHGCVIHIGSFSKSLFPGLRLGYLVAPEPFVQAARRLRGTVLRHPPGLIQRTAAHFLSLGHYDTQMHRMRKIYQTRRTEMEAALAEHRLLAGPGLQSGGSSFWLSAPEGTDTRELAMRLRERGVVIEPGHAFFADRTPERRFYRLAYSSIPATRIRAGIAHIAEAMARLRSEAPRGPDARKGRLA
ncbi:MAG: PLP-dependent aminotransferase family protein [Pseudomonadota bacterium]